MLKCYNVVGRTVVSEQGMQAWQESAYYLPKVFKSWQVNPDISGRGSCPNITILAVIFCDEVLMLYYTLSYVLLFLPIFYTTIQFP